MTPEQKPEMATSYSEMHGAGSKLTAICELPKDNCEPQILIQGNQELTVRHGSLTNSCLPPPDYRVHMRIACHPLRPVQGSIVNTF